MLTLKQIRQKISEEEQLAENILHLTANETLLSPFAQEVLSSPLYNRYILEHLDMRGGSPSRLGGFLFRGFNHINEMEASAHEVCKKLFGAQYAEFRCLSGLHAMQTTLVSLTKPGDTIMRFATKDGGHFATQHLIKLFGRKDCCYVVDKKTLRIDLEKTKEVFEREKPTLLYIDAMNYLFPFPLRELKQIVGDVPIVFDASHTLGLIAGGQFQNPLAEGADILQANTHKTFFGPQKGIILSNNRALMEKIQYDLSAGLVSSQHTTSSLALFIALHEMLVYGKEYAAVVVENAQYLAKKLYEQGFTIIGADQGYTENHQFFIDVTSLGSGPHLLQKLLAANISVNRTIPFEHVDALRFGVQEATRRGYTKEDFDRIAQWIGDLLLRNNDPQSIARHVARFVHDRQKIYYCEESSSVREPRPLVLEPHEKSPVRWVNCISQRHDITIPSDVVERVREIGILANDFDQQIDSSGNISVLSHGDVFVTVSGCYIKDLQRKDFVQVVHYDDGNLLYHGISAPSSEAYMHYLIYQKTDAAVVVHNHYLPTDEELHEFRVIVVEPQEYGSVALAEAVADACTRGNIVFVRKHGLIFHGRSVAEVEALLQKFVSPCIAEVAQ